MSGKAGLNPNDLRTPNEVIDDMAAAIYYETSGHKQWDDLCKRADRFEMEAMKQQAAARRAARKALAIFENSPLNTKPADT